ncbi:hypothetical protein JCM5296_007409 [Sporobolomyces johnsonii]
MDLFTQPFSLVQAWVPGSLDRLVSLNLVVSLAAAPLAGLIALVLLLLLTRPRISSKRPLSQTQLNTLLNRRENGGTGVWSRKWRRNVALALAIRPRRGQEDEELDDLDDIGDGEKEAWRLVVRSPPEGLRSCLKREGSFEAVTDAGAVEAPPSPLSSSPSSSSDEAQPSPSTSPSPSPPPFVTKSTKPKSVRLLEPSLADLIALRELWSSPAMQGQGGAGGIAGYRRTRDFYVRGQGGRAVVKRPGAGLEGKENGPVGGKKVNGDEGTTEEEEEDDETPSRRPSAGSTRRSLRPSAPAAPPSLPAPSSTARSSSLSPSPLPRRALSPSSPSSSTSRSPSPAFLVGAHSKTRRRALSPSGLSSSSAASRTSSLSPGSGSGSGEGGSGRGMPRWVRTKAGRGVSPAPRRVEATASDEDEEDVDEEEEAGEGAQELDTPTTATTATSSDRSSPLSGAESPDLTPTPSTNHPSSDPSTSPLVLPTRTCTRASSTSRPTETPQVMLTPSSPDLKRSAALLPSPLDPHEDGDTSESSPMSDLSTPVPIPVPKPPSTPTLTANASSSHASTSTSPLSHRRRTPPYTLVGKRATPRSAARRLSFGTTSSSGWSTPAQQLGGFTFSSPTEGKERGALDLGGLGEALEEISGAKGGRSPRSGARGKGALARKIAGLPTRRDNRARTTILDLPDELLLKVFAALNDQQGFRPLPSTSKGPEWYTPPLRIALVCKRWLPLARQLFYRHVKIHHLSRIPFLYQTFASTELSLAVRHLSINLPYQAADKLALPPVIAATSSPLREADSDSDVSTASQRKKKPREPLLPQDQLRAVFQSCSQLLSLEISGIAPSTLFSSSSNISSSLHHLHQLRLSTISTLLLKGGCESPVLTALTVRDALLALTGLQSLTLKGYVSSLSDPLDFAPTRTPGGKLARPLPVRARALLRLSRLAIVESAMSAQDLESLLKQVQRGSLVELVVRDSFEVRVADERRRHGMHHKPTVESLTSGGISELVKSNLRYLRVTLHNYPVGVDAPLPTSSPPRRSATTTGPPVDDPPHILDHFIATLSSLSTLDLGGSLCTSALLSPSSSPEPLLPPSVRKLTLRACPALTPSTVLPFLATLGLERSLAPAGSSPRRGGGGAGGRGPPRPRPTAPPSQLGELEVFGGSENGWRNPMRSWEVQRACWDAGVVWKGGEGAGAGRGGGGGATGDGGW